MSIDKFPEKSPMTYFIKSLTSVKNATYTEVERLLKYSISTDST